MRTILSICLAACGISFALPSNAQTVYKCKGASGETVYSEKPCGDKAQEVKVRVAQPNSADVAAAQIRDRDASLNMEASRIQSGAGNCISNAEGNINRPMEARVAALQQQIAQLENRTRYAKNNLAGAQYEAGLREQISGLHQAIATERSSAVQAVTAARQQCEEDRRRREDELQRKREAPPTE